MSYINENIKDCLIHNEHEEEVRIVENFFSEDILSKIVHYFDDIGWKCQCGKDPNLSNNSGDQPYWRIELEKEEFFSIYLRDIIEEWFGKNIPIESIKNMYKFTPENNVKFVLDKCKLVDKTETEIEVSELIKGNLLECISHLKYIVFTKESCFITWEICTARFHKKIKKAPKFAFIEEENSDSEPEEEIIQFF